MSKGLMRTARIAQLPLRQWGASLLELLGAISISSVILGGVAHQANTYIDNTKDAYTAQHAKAYAQAAHAYIRENKNDITTSVQRFEGSQLSQYLPAGFSEVNKNPFGQTPVLVARKISGTENIEGFLVYQVDGSNAEKRAARIPEERRPFVAALAGLGGGYVNDRNQPKGAGWDASDTYRAFRTAAAAEPGMMVVSLNLFEPADVLDTRYVCRLAGNTGCNQMELELQFADGKGISNAAYLSSTNQFVLSATSIKMTGDATFVDPAKFRSTVEITSSVKVGGGLTADTLRSTRTVVAGESCLSTEMGAIARKAGVNPDGPGTGVLMSCRKGLGENRWMWLPVFSAQEEKSSVIGCWDGNDFCKKHPKQLCWERTKDENGERNQGLVPPGADPGLECGFNWKKTTRSRRYWPDGSVRLDKAGNEQWVWETEIGERMFCALGFHGQTAPMSLESDVSGTKVYSYPAVGGGDDHTFCRVYPKAVKVNGVDTGATSWFMKVGSAYNTPIACHAVCVSEE